MIFTNERNDILYFNFRMSQNSPKAKPALLFQHVYESDGFFLDFLFLMRYSFCILIVVAVMG